MCEVLTTTAYKNPIKIVRSMSKQNACTKNIKDLFSLARMYRLFPGVNITTEIQYRFNIQYMTLTASDSYATKHFHNLVREAHSHTHSLIHPYIHPNTHTPHTHSKAQQGRPSLLPLRANVCFWTRFLFLYAGHTTVPGTHTHTRTHTHTHTHTHTTHTHTHTHTHTGSH